MIVRLRQKLHNLRVRISPPAPTLDQPRVVFMLGMPRSGTTVTKRYLGEHPDLFIAPFTHYQEIPSLYEEASGRIVVAKRNKYREQLPRILKEFGKEAWFLYIVRDPRDALVSLLEFDRHAEVPRTQDYWPYWVEMYQRLFGFTYRFKMEGNRAALLRYEDLVKGPEQIKGAFVEWLGLPPVALENRYQPDESIIESDSPHEDEKAHHHDRVHTASLQRWQGVQNPDHRAVIDGWRAYPPAEKLMRQLGYTPDGVSGLSLRLPVTRILK